MASAIRMIFNLASLIYILEWFLIRLSISVDGFHSSIIPYLSLLVIYWGEGSITRSLLTTRICVEEQDVKMFSKSVRVHVYWHSLKQEFC